MHDSHSNLFGGATISDIGRQFRSGKITIERLTRDFLDRIELLNDRLGAYEFVAADGALSTARALDNMLAAGLDLGPLMGIPIAIKDLLAVDGMPTTGGSHLDITDLVGPQGRFVSTLRRLGCVILGKAKTVEFAFGATGANASRGTPWNPWDDRIHRIPGGSSSGPAVAVAAGMCVLAVGTDTGGSVRLPAALCGVFGLKTTHGRWPTDGVLPLAPTFDSIGLLTRSAADAATAYGALCDEVVPAPPPVESLRLARPGEYFFDDLDGGVRAATDVAIAALAAAGMDIPDVDVPEARERESIFPTVLASEFIATLGRDRFNAEREAMDPVVATRAARGLDIPADQYIMAIIRHRQLVGIALDRMDDHDGWICPTAALVTPPVEDFLDVELGLKLALAITRNTQPANLFGQCAISLPITPNRQALPVGLQIAAAPGRDARLLAMGVAVENILGRPRLPDIAAFVLPKANAGRQTQSSAEETPRHV